MPVAFLVPLDDLSTKAFVLALMALPIGALCGYLVWGYWENVSRKD
jgi:hypothetical protein